MESDTLIGQTIHTNLFIKSKLGEGGMGTVYLAENAGLREKKYAVKVLRRELTLKPGFRERFYEEAKHQAQLDHPNIVQMYDYFNFGDDYFLILEYVDGQSLGDIIDASNGPLPQKLALPLIRDVLAGLNCAHEKGILHRDVKPSNVMVDKSGRARLTDFGIASQLGGPSRSEAGMTLGTAEYMSPEQIQNPGTVDHRSDVYSAGIVLFEMLTGKLPFSEATPAAVQRQQLTAPVPDPRTLNPALDKQVAEIVRKAMRKDPDERFQGCLEFQKAVEAYIHPPARLWALWGFLVLASAAAAFYFFKTLPETEHAVRGLAMSASGKYGLMCKDAKTRASKRIGLQLARDAGKSGLADDFERQVTDLSANINDFAASYVKEITAMTTYSGRIVQRVLAYQPTVADAPDRLHYWQLATRDYGRLAAGQTLPGMEAMIADCPP